MSFDLSPEKLALLDALLEDDEDAPRAIEPRDERSTAPLSFGQERLFFVERLMAGSPAYNIPIVLDLDGPFDHAAFEAALRRVADRHEMLRARVDATSLRWTLDATEVPFESRTVTLDEADAIENDEATRLFDLERGPLWRVKLLRLGPDRHRLLLTMHHIISEAWTCALLLREVAAVLRGEELPSATLDYGDFAAWQRDLDEDAGVAHFVEHLRDVPVLELPTDRPRRAERRFVGGWAERLLSPQRAAGIRELARAHRATLHMVMLAAFGTLIHRRSGERDFAIGTPVSLRSRVELESLVGFFVNTVAIRQRFDPDGSFADLLERTRASALDAFSHRSVPFERVVEELAPGRALAQSPVFQVAMVVQDTPEDADWRHAFEVPGIDAHARVRPSGTAKFDLTLEVEDLPEGLRCALEYDSDLFDRGTAESLLEQLDRVLDRLVADPSTKLGDVALIADDERARILESWNPPRLSALPETIHGAFMETAREHSDRIALVDGDRSFSYAELDEWTHAIAARLVDAGVRVGEPVAIVAERSAELVAGMLGVLKAGAAYLPLDASYPADRQALMISDAKARFALGTDAPEGLTCISLSNEAASPFEAPSVGPDDLAYVLFTSGSTGRPKGVLTPHRGVVRLVRDTSYVDLHPTDVFPQVANASFDAITFEVWGALLNGGRVVIIPRDDVLDPHRLATALRETGATTMFLTVALFNRVAAEAPDAFGHMRTLIVGGEALDPKWVRRVLESEPPERFLNGYGPTEVTTFACTHHVEQIDAEATSIPIGRAIARTRAYVLDERMQVVPPGVHGELYLGGPGVAKGYLNRPELTAERFVSNPFGDGELYRTGDIVRWLADGTIDFIGRRDHQVKLRGFRIELGEIEACLEQHSSVDEAACVVRGEGEERRLVAYVTGRDETAVLRAHVADALPAHMVPSAFVHLDLLPLDPNGKLDRRALPDPRFSVERAPLETATERAVGRAFSDALGVEDVHASDDFFVLGGSSLMALPLVRDLSTRFGIDLPLTTLFRTSTVRGLAQVIDRLRARPPSGAVTLQFGPLSTGRIQAFPFEPLVAIQPHGSRPAIYCVHGAGGNVVSFRGLAEHLGIDRPFYGLQAQGIDGIRKPLESIEAMAEQYVDALVEHDPGGPYVLAGYSGGGVIAFEMAHQLRREGLDVSAVLMLDAGAGRLEPESATEKQKRRLAGLLEGGVAYATEKLLERAIWDAWRARSKAAELGKWIGRAIPHDIRNRYMVEAFSRARGSYSLQPLDVPLIVFSARQGTREDAEQAELGWRPLAPHVRVHLVPGDHGSLLIEPHVAELAVCVDRALREHGF